MRRAPLLRGLLFGLALAGAVRARAEERIPPAVHARFELRAHGRIEQLELVRTQDRIEYRFVERGYSELWQRDARGQLEHVRSFPGDGKSVHYSQGDLRTIGLEADWSALSSLLTASERAGLTRAGASRRLLGHVGASLRGSLRGEPARVLWLDDMALPGELRLGAGKAQVTLALVELTPCGGSAVCAEPDLSELRSLEFADLGDMEYDPFVRRYLAREARDSQRAGRALPHVH